MGLLSTNTTKHARGNGKAMPPPAEEPKRRGRPPGSGRRAATIEAREVPSGRIKIPALEQGELDALMKETPNRNIRISAPRLMTANISIEGISPYVQNAFAEKQRQIMEDIQRQGQQARGRRVRNPKDFDENYKNAQHRSEEGWLGIPAPAFRNAMIDACRLCGIKMTHAKLSIFIEADGLDVAEGTPLVKIIGDPQVHKASVRNESGVADIRWRPMWRKWSALVRVTWDLDQYNSIDIGNLFMRAGLQVGIGEGRPGSPNSNGLGWGRFEVVD
jgi:hypothetical protein